MESEIQRHARRLAHGAEASVPVASSAPPGSWWWFTKHPTRTMLLGCGWLVLAPLELALTGSVGFLRVLLSLLGVVQVASGYASKRYSRKHEATVGLEAAPGPTTVCGWCDAANGPPEHERCNGQAVTAAATGFGVSAALSVCACAASGHKLK